YAHWTIFSKHVVIEMSFFLFSHSPTFFTSPLILSSYTLNHCLIYYVYTKYFCPYFSFAFFFILSSSFTSFTFASVSIVCSNNDVDNYWSDTYGGYCGY